MPEVLKGTVPAGSAESYEEYTKEDAIATGQLSGQSQENDGTLHLQRNQKFALVFICVLTMGVVALGILQAKNVLKIPVAGLDKAATQQIAGTALAEVKKESSEELKKKDTDADGVNDFEEINIYDTSPYLADSDSDGVSDFNEIKAGEDPTCPKGQECFRNTNGANLANNANTLDTNGANTLDTNGANTNANNANTTVTPAQLRQVLISSGQLTKEQADQIDDQTLMDVYKEALAKQPQTTQTGQTPQITQTTPNTQTIGDPASLTPAQIKQLLLEQGVDEATLSKVDDATLKQLYLDALNQLQETP